MFKKKILTTKRRKNRVYLFKRWITNRTSYRGIYQVTKRKKHFFKLLKFKEKKTELVNHTEGHFNLCVIENIKTAVVLEKKILL